MHVLGSGKNRSRQNPPIQLLRRQRGTRKAETVVSWKVSISRLGVVGRMVPAQAWPELHVFCPMRGEVFIEATS